MSDCIFCMIANKDIPSKVAYEDDRILVFHDLEPQAPVHVLIIPNKHIPSVNELEKEDAELIGRMTLVAKQLASQLGVHQSGYRLVINTGPDSGQSVFHLHMHLLGGWHLGARPV